jgi:hypothetical protein
MTVIAGNFVDSYHETSKEQRTMTKYASLLIIGLVASFTMLANSNGVPRRAVLTSAGCGPSGCHGGSKNTNTAVSVTGLPAGTDLQAVAGQALDLTISVKNPTAMATGINLAIRTELNGTTNAGTFTAAPSSGLRMQGGELVHSTPKNLAGGEATFAIKWNAPAEPGTYYLHVIANAVNRNGGPDLGDQWNWMEPVKIVVSTTSSVNDRNTAIAQTLDLRPIPAHGDVFMTIPEHAADELFSMSIVNAHGMEIYRRDATTTNEQVMHWDGRTAEGTHAAPGTYVVVLSSERRVLHGRAIIIR